jgi:hypothetical protein
VRYAPTAEDREALELLAQRDDLTEWEDGLLESLSEQDTWSEKQRACFETLWERKSNTPMSR